MNTGADDDSRSTPTLAFSISSARASEVPASASRPATISRANPVIQFPPRFIIELDTRGFGYNVSAHVGFAEH